MWEELGVFFTAAICHKNPLVSFHTCEVLKQLASSLLEKNELNDYLFQKSFLKPFEVCFAETKEVELKQHILSSMMTLVDSRAPNIKSGWK